MAVKLSSPITVMPLWLKKSNPSVDATEDSAEHIANSRFTATSLTGSKSKGAKGTKKGK